MEGQKEIESWCRDERFMYYANKRMLEEINDVPGNRLFDPQYEELDEAFDLDDRYIVPLAAYLTYRLQLAKLQRDARRRKRGIWRVFVQVTMLGYCVDMFAGELGGLLTELREAVMRILHEEYVRKSNAKKQ